MYLGINYNRFVTGLCHVTGNSTFYTTSITIFHVSIALYIDYYISRFVAFLQDIRVIRHILQDLVITWPHRGHSANRCLRPLYLTNYRIGLAYLVQCFQHIVRHMVLYHHWAYQHLVKVTWSGPKRLVYRLVFVQHLSETQESNVIFTCQTTC